MKGLEEIMRAAEVVGSVKPSAIAAGLDIDPAALRQAAEEAAEEEFAVLPGLPPDMDAAGDLSKVGLSEEQAKAVRCSLATTFILAALVGALLELSILAEERP